MKFSVKYVLPMWLYKPNIYNPNIEDLFRKGSTASQHVARGGSDDTFVNFFGKGAVHLLETGIVLEGMIPRLNIQMPVLALFAFEKVLCGHTIRSVPYSVIESYRYVGYHVLVFGMPFNGCIAPRQAVWFTLEEPQRNAELSHWISEYTAVAGTFERR